MCYMNRLITREEILRYMKDSGNRAIPAWLEINTRHNTKVDENERFEAVTVNGIDDEIEDEKYVFININRNFDLDSYGKSWRLWYVCGPDAPDAEIPWESFSWEHGS